MNGRIYTAATTTGDAPTSGGFLKWQVGSSVVVKLHEIFIKIPPDRAGLESYTGEYNEQMGIVTVESGFTTYGGTDGSLTVPRLPGDPASSTIVEEINAIGGEGDPTGGTPITLFTSYINVRLPFRHLFLPGTELILEPGSIGHITFKDASGSILNSMTGSYIVIEEIG